MINRLSGKLPGIWLAALCMVFASTGHAEPGPDVLIKATTEKVLAELSANRDELTADKRKLYQLVDKIILPHFDFAYMSRLVLGKHWRKANSEQQDRFVSEFKALLVRTYATALFEYTGQKIDYKPYRSSTPPDRAVVRTEVKPEDGPPIPLDYSLAQGEGGKWRVHDIRIDGISLVTNYRTTYSRRIQKSGIDGLIDSLAEKNEELKKQ